MSKIVRTIDGHCGEFLYIKGNTAYIKEADGKVWSCPQSDLRNLKGKRMSNKQKLALMSGLTEMDYKWLGVIANFESMKIYNFYYNQQYGIYMPNFRWKY